LYCIESFISNNHGILFDIMGEDETKVEELSELFEKEISMFTSDEDLAIHLMHRFNIDRDTLETLPAFDEPLRPLLWPEKKE